MNVSGADSHANLNAPDAGRPLQTAWPLCGPSSRRHSAERLADSDRRPTVFRLKGQIEASQRDDFMPFYQFAKLARYACTSILRCERIVVTVQIPAYHE